MITQRFVGDQGSMTGRLTIENVPGDVTGYAELLGLEAELKLRVNVHTEGQIITGPPVEDENPPG
jgi:hypothetical protein